MPFFIAFLMKAIPATKLALQAGFAENTNLAENLRKSALICV